MEFIKVITTEINGKRYLSAIDNDGNVYTEYPLSASEYMCCMYDGKVFTLDNKALIPIYWIVENAKTYEKELPEFLAVLHKRIITLLINEED